jgi:predicted GIY-YIG superfamily endonuclease
MTSHPHSALILGALKSITPDRLQKAGTVYLLHFDRPYYHARHYLGWSTDLDVRLADHAAGQGTRLLQVISAAGIHFTVARTWSGGRKCERRLKGQKHGPRLCPLCQTAAANVHPGRARVLPRHTEGKHHD